MTAPLRWLGAVAAYAALAVFVGYFSQRPQLVLRGPDEAVIKLSVSQQGQLRYECRRRSAEELQELPQNMRSVMDCPRERWPVSVSLHVDGAPLFESVVPPTGLADDGISYVYRRMRVPAGRHAVTLTIVDSGAEDARPRRRTRQVTLTPGQVLVVEYVNGRFGFIHRGERT